METVLLPIRYNAQNKDVQLKIDINDKMPHHVSSDPNRVQQVIVYLALNAIKVSPPKSTVSIKASFDNLKIYKKHQAFDFIVDIKDSGVGLTGDQIKNIFHPYEIYTEYGSTGLGFSICYKIVSVMNGSIKVSSQVADGTAFTVRIPFVSYDAMVENALCPTLDKSLLDRFSVQRKLVNEEALIKKNPDRIKNAKIMVVDDSAINRIVMKKVLQNLGVENIIEAENGLHALKIIRQDELDLIFLDLLMPIMDGYQAVIEIRKFNKTLPIFAVSANNCTKQEMEKIKNVGFNSFCPKPFLTKDITQIFNEYLE